MTEDLHVADSAKSYVAHESTDDIMKGKDLRDGMIVLIEDPVMRYSAGAGEWCEVTRLEVIPTRDWPMVKFVGRYADGTMRVRSYAASYEWIVKRADS